MADSLIGCARRRHHIQVDLGATDLLHEQVKNGGEVSRCVRAGAVVTRAICSPIMSSLPQITIDMPSRDEANLEFHSAGQMQAQLLGPGRFVDHWQLYKHPCLYSSAVQMMMRRS